MHTHRKPLSHIGSFEHEGEHIASYTREEELLYHNNEPVLLTRTTVTGTTPITALRVEGYTSLHSTTELGDLVSTTTPVPAELHEKIHIALSLLKVQADYIHIQE